MKPLIVSLRSWEENRVLCTPDFADFADRRRPHRAYERMLSDRTNAAGYDLQIRDKKNQGRSPHSNRSASIRDRVGDGVLPCFFGRSEGSVPRDRSLLLERTYSVFFMPPPRIVVRHHTATISCSNCHICRDKTRGIHVLAKGILYF